MNEKCQGQKSFDEPFFAGVLDADTLDEILQNPQSELSRTAAQCSALEIRYDLLLSSGYSRESLGGVAGRVRRAFPDVLLIGTFRLERDGGKFPDSRAMDRAEYICEILTADVFPDYLDIEAEEYVKLEGRIFEIWQDARKLPIFGDFPKKVLVSHHDFRKVPTWDELERLRKCATGPECAGLKIACMSRSLGDFDNVYPWIKAVREDGYRFELFSCFAMGKSGEESRVKSLAFGANLTYCLLGAAVASGQIPVAEARNAYRKLLSKG